MKLSFNYCILLFFFHTFSTGCNHKDANTETTLNEKDNFYYNLYEPSDTIFLPYELEEISALGWYDQNRVLCVQDEEGVLYLYDYKKKDIANKMRFGGSGDYEGVELVNDTIYIFESNGTLYKTNLDGNEEKTIQIKTPLKTKNDIEGLAFDKVNKRLLIACKEAAGINKKMKDVRAIYGFDISSNSLSNDPVYLINEEEVAKSLKSGTKKSKRENTTLGPSGIAVHPINKKIFVLSHTNKVLIILNPDGSLDHTIKLKTKLFRQAEGICFSPEGDLFISNEGDGGKATLLIFNYLKK